MDTLIIDGRAIAGQIKEEIRSRLSTWDHKPVICDVVVGQSSVVDQFVNVKKRASESVGFGFEIHRFSEDVDPNVVEANVKMLSERKDVCGVIVQLPLPFDMGSTQNLLAAIDVSKDVDCLSPKSRELFYSGHFSYVPPVAAAVVRMLDSVQSYITPQGKYLIVGLGSLVGAPVAQVLRSRGLKPDMVDKQTEQEFFLQKVKEADVLILGAGVPCLIKPGMVKSGVVVIDCGTSAESGSVVGDADPGLLGVASVLSPVPGGVGPVAVACLLENAMRASSEFAKIA